jgi:hypothetical protein
MAGRRGILVCFQEANHTGTRTLEPFFGPHQGVAAGHDHSPDAAVIAFCAYQDGLKHVHTDSSADPGGTTLGAFTR